MVLLLALAGQALACACPVPSLNLVSPPMDADEVPTNARVTWGGISYTLLPPLRATADGAEVAVQLEEVAHNGMQTLLIASFDAPLPPHARVEVIDPAWDDVLARFTTGAGPDTEPPRWTGRVTARTDRGIKVINCDGEAIAHHLTVEGATDDTTAAENLLVEVLPTNVGEPFWGAAGQASVAQDEECLDMDPTLLETPARTYAVRLIDVAGNATEPVQVSVCGCASGPASGPGTVPSTAFVVALLALRRRSRAG